VLIADDSYALIPRQTADVKPGAGARVHAALEFFRDFRQ